MSLTNGDPAPTESEDGGGPKSAAQDAPLVIVAIDDDPGILGFYQKVMSIAGVRFEGSTDPRQALDLVVAHDPSLVILDLTMPGINGMELLHQIKNRDPRTRVAMITGYYTIDTALKAIQEGAIDYICKPVSAEKLLELVTRVRSLVTQEERTRALERELADVSNLEGIVGHSPRMREVFDLIQRVAPHFRTALIIGEPGSGRKIVARALHNLSPGKSRRFAILRGATVAAGPGDPATSAEQGDAFTGAEVSESELFESAISGTIFVHEVGDLSAATQLRLLRFLDQLAARELAAPPAPQDDLRIIAATSRDLPAETQAGEFRSDLWLRLSTVEIHLPPLRERTEDVLLLARHFLSQFSAQHGKPVPRMSRGAEAALVAYSWPGNVRELENVINNACELASGNVLDCGDLPTGVVLPGYGDDFLFRGPRGPSAGTAQKSSSTETLRKKVRDIFDH
jgi:DNA-binding NtrC family response regulator